MGYTKTIYNNVKSGDVIATPGGDVAVIYVENNETSVSMHTRTGGIIMGHPSEGVWVAESEEGAGGAKKEARRAEEREERITEAKERLEDFGSIKVNFQAK